MDGNLGWVEFTTWILPFELGCFVEIAAVQRILEEKVRLLVRLYRHQAVKSGVRRYNRGALYKYPPRVGRSPSLTEGVITLYIPFRRTIVSFRQPSPHSRSGIDKRALAPRADRRGSEGSRRGCHSALAPGGPSLSNRRVPGGAHHEL
jgi:hypothetical protein